MNRIETWFTDLSSPFRCFTIGREYTVFLVVSRRLQTIARTWFHPYSICRTNRCIVLWFETETDVDIVESFGKSHAFINGPDGSWLSWTPRATTFSRFGSRCGLDEWERDWSTTRGQKKMRFPCWSVRFFSYWGIEEEQNIKHSFSVF